MHKSHTFVECFTIQKHMYILLLFYYVNLLYCNFDKNKKALMHIIAKTYSNRINRYNKIDSIIVIKLQLTI